MNWKKFILIVISLIFLTLYATFWISRNVYDSYQNHTDAYWNDPEWKDPAYWEETRLDEYGNSYLVLTIEWQET